MTYPPCVAIVQHENGWLQFTGPVSVETAYSVDEVLPVLDRIETAVNRENLHAAGFVSYEAAPAFDSACTAHEPDTFPLAWFGLFRDCEPYYFPKTEHDLPPAVWQPSVTREEYDRAFAAIRNFIACGHTYQVNYSFRLRTESPYDPRMLFDTAALPGHTRYGAFIDTGRHVICSLSPELFFDLEDGRITCRPMKGTAPRGTSAATDCEAASWLRASEKNRAENIMIVDMIRNDLGRIASPGAVTVSSLWDVERYPTVWQMTSTVSARTDAGLGEIFQALFPCASVTGAPKIRTMGIIRELEPEPRHLYTGSVGYVAPGGRARFNVAIRTVLYDRNRLQAEYGVGGGIVWDSVNVDEYDECLTKARIIMAPYPPFSLLETILWEPENGFFLLERHCARLSEAAGYFCIPLDMRVVERILMNTTASLTQERQRVRLTVSRDSSVMCEATPLDQGKMPETVRVRLAVEPVDTDSPFIHFKTTHRQVYEKVMASATGLDDVLLWNRRGEITESTIANVVFEKDGFFVTPPLECGLLGGTFRSELIESGVIGERIVRVDELDSFDAVFLINSVRKWRRVKLLK